LDVEELIFLVFSVNVSIDMEGGGVDQKKSRVVGTVGGCFYLNRS
jgi:hypothetical protein